MKHKNNSAQALSTKNLFFGCKKIDNNNNKKKEAKKRTDKKEVMYNNNNDNVLLLLLLLLFLHQLLLVCPLLCFLLLLLSVLFFASSSSSFVVYHFAPEEENFCRKRLCTVVSLCFVALVRTFPRSVVNRFTSNIGITPLTDHHGWNGDVFPVSCWLTETADVPVSQAKNMAAPTRRNTAIDECVICHYYWCCSESCVDLPLVPAYLRLRFLCRLWRLTCVRST